MFKKMYFQINKVSVRCEGKCVMFIQMFSFSRHTQAYCLDPDPRVTTVARNSLFAVILAT